MRWDPEMRVQACTHPAMPRPLPELTATAVGTGSPRDSTKLVSQHTKFCVFWPLGCIVAPGGGGGCLLGCLEAILQGCCEVFADALKGGLDEVLSTLHTHTSTALYTATRTDVGTLVMLQQWQSLCRITNCPTRSCQVCLKQIYSVTGQTDCAVCIKSHAERRSQRRDKA